MRILPSAAIKYSLLCILLAATIGGVFYFAQFNNTGQPVFTGTVIRTETREREEFGQMRLYHHIYAELNEGPSKDMIVEFEEPVENINPEFWVKKNTKILISSFTDEQGEDIFVLSDIDRRQPIYAIWILFVLFTVWVGRTKGLLAIAGMLLTLAVIFLFIIPRLLDGADPVQTSIAGALFMLPTVLYLSHGFNKKSNIAAVSTALSVLLIVILYKFFGDIAFISGFSSEETTHLPALLGSNDLRGILLASIIIGAIGMLDDITVSQVSVVAELKTANERYGFKELWEGAMRVGRDHINAIINTLILAYTGASFPLLILLYANNQPGAITISGEDVATEILRALLGSIGIVAAVPITTFIASAFFSGERHKTTQK